MRDPDRIEEVLRKLESYRRDHSDLRLAQIVSNAAQTNGYGDDPFYMEDGELASYLDEELEE